MAAEHEPPRRVVIVEDDDDSRALTDLLLTLSGFAVRSFHAAERALPILFEDPPDALVTDVFLPRMDGRTLASMVRSRVRSLPIVAVTGDAGAHAGREFDALFVKPMDPDIFLLTVNRLVEARRRKLGGVAAA